MPDDNIIDFGKFKKNKNAPQNQEEREMDEMMDRLSALPVHMQEYITNRFAFLTMYTMVAARTAEMLKEAGYDPDEFDPEEESTEAFLSYGPFESDEDREPLWNGPMFDCVKKGVTYRVASTIEMEGQDGFNLSLDILKRKDHEGNWKIFMDNKWQDDGPPDEYFHYLSMLRGWDLDDEDDDPESVFDLDLPSNVISALARNDIETIEDLCNKTAQELLSLKGIGKKSLDMITEVLNDLGLQLKETPL